ncbi:MAG: DUF1993 domain-containing protein [Polyangiaceae bacterium]
MYFESFLQFKKMLGQVSTWLDKTEAYAKERGFDPNVLVTARLAPDQFAFARQIQIACDTLKLGASRLTGKDAPSHADTEQTLAELRERVKSVVAYLDHFTAKDFEGTDARSVTQPRWEGKVMTGKDYFFEHVQPNFYFHLAHAFAILRHNGVPVGKKDYLGALTQRMP